MSAGARREHLLDAAKELVAAHGFHALSIEAVARAAGITRPIVYRHFGDLAGLLEALIDRETTRALGQLREFLPADLGGDDPRPGLLAALDGYLHAVRDDPVTWRLVLMPPEARPACSRERIAAGRAAVVAQLAPPSGRARRLARPRADGPLAVRRRRRGGAAHARRSRALPARADRRPRAVVVQSFLQKDLGVP